MIQYVRHRAVLGANYHRIDWASLSDLPAPPRSCMRRMAFLNGNLRFRKAVNRLCSMLSERYAKQLEKSQNLSSNKDDCRLFVQSQSSKGAIPDVDIQMSSLNGEAWDDFENKSMKTALDEILRCKMMAKLESASQNVQSQYEDWNRYVILYDFNNNINNLFKKKKKVIILIIIVIVMSSYSYGKKIKNTVQSMLSKLLSKTSLILSYCNILLLISYPSRRNLCLNI